MTPIVNGLTDEYDGRVTFHHLDARDEGTGQRAFEALTLSGHPAFVVFDAQGRETYRAFGVLEVDALREALDALLADSG
jgi:hypothetical protein